jgi:hypothetical protein
MQLSVESLLHVSHKFVPCWIANVCIVACGSPWLSVEALELNQLRLVDRRLKFYSCARTHAHTGCTVFNLAILLSSQIIVVCMCDHGKSVLGTGWTT